MIKGKSLSQLAYEFIAYKKSNGYVYSNAEYYLNVERRINPTPKSQIILV